ncbi:hypothetical protein QR77_41285 [Streptomyces sp. 150FB]|nr:hypothetical protein QR77_41285 [Streptomyces sp. 150FB]
MLLPDRAAPGVQDLAESLADGACHLADAASPGAWNLPAVEDAVDTVVRALSAIDPEAARILSSVPAATVALLCHAGGTDIQDQEESTVPGAGTGLPAQGWRSRRRGLGPGYQGIRAPE